MRKFIYLIIAFMLMFIFSGCASVPQQRKETYDLGQTVGNKPFVGPTGTDARGLARPMIGH